MAAVLLTGYGGFDRLHFRSDVAVPKPGPDDVLVRIGAAGVNNTDINTRAGWYARGVREGTSTAGAAAGFEAAGGDDRGWTGVAHAFPRIQGADGCGQVVAVGEGVTPARVGERVLIDPIIRPASEGGATAYLGSEVDGAFAEYARVPAVNAVTVRSALSDVELASFPCAYGAAEHMLERAGVSAGERVLVTGASGGVGSAAVQLARRRGAEVIASVSAAKAAAVRALGASHTLERDDDPLARLGAESVDAVIDVVGGRHFGRYLDVLRRRGRYAVAGAISGPVVELDLRTLYLKDLRLEGCTIFPAQVFRNLVAYIEQGEIRPLIADVYPLAEIVAAQQAFLSKAHTGKIVLKT